MERLRERMVNFRNSYTSFRINPHAQLGKLCVYGMYKRAVSVPTEENALEAVDMEACRMAVRPNHSVSCPHSWSRGQPCPPLENLPGRQRWAVVHSRGKKADS